MTCTGMETDSPFGMFEPGVAVTVPLSSILNSQPFGQVFLSGSLNLASFGSDSWLWKSEVTEAPALVSFGR